MFTQKKTLFSILLAVAILATSVAWAPMGVTANPGDENPPESPETQCVGLNDNNSQTLNNCGWRYAARPRITLYISGNLLILDGVRLARRHTFNIRARKPGGDWFSLGSVRATRAGKVSDIFRLPASSRRAQRLYVCLKDLDSGKAYCGWARRRY